MKNSVELKETRSILADEYKKIIETAKTENRSLTEEETQLLDEKKSEIENINEELRKQKETLEKYEKTILIEEEEKRQNDKNISTNNMKKENLSLVKELRNAIETGKDHFSFPAMTETREVTVQGANGVHDAVIETEIQGILEPLYSKSILNTLGVRWYKGMPMGDIQVPIMGKGSCGWVGEVSAASASGNTFTTKKLTPKRLSAYVDISKQLLVQDNIGTEEAIRNDLVNALQDKLEATIFGSENKTDNKPAGIFYGVTATEIEDYKDLCDFEADLDDENINGEKKYVLSNKSRAYLRSTIKGTNATGMILENGTVDGTPMTYASNVPANKMVYGDWNYLAVAQFGNVELQIFEDAQLAVNGLIRIVINAYFDEAILRPEAFVFGETPTE